MDSSACLIGVSHDKFQVFDGVATLMSGLKFNFNKPKAAPQPPKPAPSTSKSAFDDEYEDDAFPKPSKNKSQPEAIAGLNKDLRTYTSLSQNTAARMAREALETDPSVFAYDEVYDDLKQVEIEKKKAAEQDRLERKVCHCKGCTNGSQNIWINYLLLQKYGNGTF